MTLFASTIALSAFLLFLVQPIIAKQILPWFGGSAAVWTTCMVFFQLVLLAGYFYSDTLIRKVGPRKQAIIHTVLLLVSLALLPIIPSEAFKPTDASDPVGRILLLLAATIGLPYLMLSTTGPLVQAWFARRYQGGQVYRLYSLSNIASMLALIVYPPLIEPLTSGKVQSWGWSAAYAVFAVLAAVAAWVSVRNHEGALPVATPAAAPVAAPQSATEASDPTAASSGASPGWKEQSLWLLLSALGSVMLLSVTTHITQNVASIPFLWVMPLALYLITFIMCFDGKGWYKRSLYVPLAGVLTILMLAALSWRLQIDTGAHTYGVERAVLPLAQAVALYGVGLFVCCMFCHGELVDRKPAPQHLTRFYLMVSLGGAVGGLLVGLVAPVVYSWYWEFPLALVLITLLALFLSKGRTMIFGAVCFCLALIGYVDYSRYIREDGVAISRNFYGTLRVKATAPDTSENARWRLLHGVITHGEQYRNPKFRTLPTTYYGEASGIGRTIKTLREFSPGTPQRVGLIGLGVGTLAAYGRAGDQYRIYELNPQVLELARSHFTYLSQSPANIAVQLGDARLVLEKEPDQKLDVLAIDAFSSDSIPVHLITQEAIRLYRRHMNENGAIVFHISNRYLDLNGVVRQLADTIGWQALRVIDDPSEDSYLYRSDWVVLTRNERLIQSLRTEAKAQDVPSVPGRRPWTDDHNNLFEVLK
ncbi:MAG TPA: fused MFS/spermidine synthase [Burkholderiaceae bacterium]|nr:fused MFS/spermidine synthase [Burkholderiaceae bacterium]